MTGENHFAGIGKIRNFAFSIIPYMNREGRLVSSAGGKEVKFTKMHGAGNDYIYINGFETIPEDLNRLAEEVSDRHFGIGADGLVVILPSETADFRMRMFNADGTEAEMCGNATRCVGKYVYEKGLTDSDMITLETLAGIKVLKLRVDNGKVKEVTVDMGIPELEPAKIPVISPAAENMINRPVTVNGNEYYITAISMGNPHAVIFVDEITDHHVLTEGPELEKADIFPRKANIEFVKIEDRNNIKMRVWERGTGETLACGTGACASVVASILNGHTDRNVAVHLTGGILKINCDENSGHIYMTGPAEFICEGIFYRK